MRGRSENAGGVVSIRRWSLALALVLIALAGARTVFAGDAATQPSGSGLTASDGCASCHPGPARDWAKGKMAKVMDCQACHGDAHSGDSGYENVKMPTPNTCRQCHEEQVAQFEKGKHALAGAAAHVVPNYRVIPESARSTGCDGCHSIGHQWDDGSSGECNACHGRHSFSVAEASEPEACGHCHRGDHPQSDMWEVSRHGQLYLLTRDDTRAPKCQTCHMQNGSHAVMTSWGFLGLRGEEPDPEWAAIRIPVDRMLADLGPGKSPNVRRESLEEWQAYRDTMIDTCAGCHSVSFAKAKLSTADAHLKESDRLFSQISQLGYVLKDQGILDEMQRSTLVRDSLAHRLSSFMGGFHFAYEFAWDKGYLALMDDMLQIKDRAVSGAMMKLIQEKLGVNPGAIPGAAPGLLPQGMDPSRLPAGMAPALSPQGGNPGQLPGGPSK